MINTKLSTKHEEVQPKYLLEDGGREHQEKYQFGEDSSP